MGGGLSPADVDLETDLVTADGHITCCQLDPPRFICGSPFHPECAVADDEPARCARCLEIHRHYVCDRGHHHCPLQSTTPQCPDKKEPT